MTSGTQPKGTPKKVEVTMYDVGFGDCFLLSFIYAGNKVKRVLIDCGSRNAGPKAQAAASQVVADSGGHVDALVLTHRHSDHLSAFGYKASGPKLAGLSPDLILQPWTEDPLLDDQATSPEGKHVQLLAAAQGFAAALAGNVAAAAPDASKRQQELIEYINGLSISNKAALKCIAGMKGKHEYLKAGATSGLGALLPGVAVTVLGPPTLDVCPAMKTESSSNPKQFWELQAGIAKALRPTGQAAGGDALFPGAPTVDPEKTPPEVRWIVGHLNGIGARNLEGFVRRLDNAINNTSLILLLEVGGKALLFPGDAQWESWSYALGQSQWREQLKGVDLYKVGHHGSGNATPKKLWNLFSNKGKEGKRGSLISLMSTHPKVYNGVPAKTLAPELEALTHLTRSDDLAGADFYRATVAI